MFLTQRDYVERQYAAPPASETDYVFIEGEPVTLSLVLSNEGELPVQLQSNAASLERSSQFVVLRKVGNDWSESQIEVAVDGTLTVSGATPAFKLDWNTPLELPAKMRMTTKVSLVEPLAAGLYHLVVRDVGINCQPDCRIRNHATTVRFEVRSSKEVPERLELLTRRAVRSIDSGSFTDAERAIDEMLRIHPQSVIAHQLRGQLGERVKQPVQAEEAYRQALTLLVSGADVRLRQETPEERQQRMHHLRQRLAKARRRR